jgi:hypothetical protein
LLESRDWLFRMSLSFVLSNKFLCSTPEWAMTSSLYRLHSTFIIVSRFITLRFFVLIISTCTDITSEGSGCYWGDNAFQVTKSRQLEHRHIITDLKDWKPSSKNHSNRMLSNWASVILKQYHPDLPSIGESCTWDFISYSWYEINISVGFTSHYWEYSYRYVVVVIILQMSVLLRNLCLIIVLLSLALYKSLRLLPHFHLRLRIHSVYIECIIKKATQQQTRTMVQKWKKKHANSRVIYSHNLPRKTWVKVALDARPLLTPGAQKLWMSDHGVFMSRTCVHSRTLHRTEFVFCYQWSI